MNFSQEQIDLILKPPNRRILCLPINWLKYLALKIYFRKKKQSRKPHDQKNSHSSGFASFILSLFLRLTCIGVLVHVTVVMIHESDSWLPALNLVFCLGIFVDLICFMRSKKEHVGINLFLLFYSLGMIPALWFQHEIITSLLAKYSNRDTGSKYSSDSSLEETRSFEAFLYATLLLVRTCLPRNHSLGGITWNLRSSLELVLTDITYMTDALDFSKILFDDSRMSMDKTYKTIVLSALSFTSCLFCLNFVYKPLKRIHIRHVYSGLIDKVEQAEIELASDPFIRFLMPSLFYEIPMTIARTIIFYSGYSKANWDGFIFLLKNAACILITIAAFFETRQLDQKHIFYSNYYI